MDFGLRLEGMDELFKAIDAAERRFDKILDRAVRAGARVILRAYRQKLRAHRQTGELEKHTAARRYKRKPGFVGYVIGPAFPGMTAQQRSYHGAWLEEGHRKAKPIKGYRLAKFKNAEARKAFALEHGSSMVKAYPTLRPAFDENKQKAIAEMARVFKAALEGADIPESDLEATLESFLFGG